MTATVDPCRAWVQLEHEVVAAYRAGTSVARLRALHGLGKEQVKGILRRAGVDLETQAGRRPLVPAETQAEMCRLSDEGLSAYEVAAITGWSRGAVCRALERRRE